MTLPEDHRGPTGRQLLWLVAALGLVALVFATQLFASYRTRGVPVAFGATFLTQLVQWEAWAVAGPLVWRLAHRWPLVPGRFRSSLLKHAATAPLVTVAILAFNLLIYHAMIRLPVVATWFRGFDRSFADTAMLYALIYTHVELMMYAAIVAAAHASHASERLRAREREALRLESELSGARLAALRAQLQPHFLFNTLHTIGSLVLQRDNDRAVSMLSELGELLRGTLAHRDTELTTLGDEIEHLRRYLRIEETRFGDRLTVELSVPDSAAAALVPPFILQPIVENAFRHGVAHRLDAATVRIRADADERALRIDVYNDGPPLPPAFSLDGAKGYGLKNVRERLRARSPAGDLTIHTDGDGVRASLVVPQGRA